MSIIIITPILEMEKLQLKKFNILAKVIASKWKICHSVLAGVIPKLV